MKTILIILLVFSFSACSSSPRVRERPFTVSLSSPNEELGIIEMQLERAFPRTGLRKVDVIVTYFPDEDAVCLFYRSDFFNYHQFWSANCRDVFLKALEKYEEDYAQRNLTNNRRRTADVYGTSTGFLIWQMFNFTARAQANMGFEFGYAFIERFPYFAVIQKLTTFEDPIDIENNRNSQEITMLFTRAQARVLAGFFDPLLLQEFTIGRRPRSIEHMFDVDLYDEDADVSGEYEEYEGF